MNKFFYVGGRQYKWSPEQYEVAMEGDWILHGTGASPCGRYENYKLYLSGSSARKRVFYISRRVDSGLFAQGGDLLVLQQDFPGVQEWITDVLAGRPGILPKFEFSVVNRKRKPPRPAERPDEASMEVILSHIRQAEIEGEHLSMFPQTKATGRYAPNRIGKAAGMRHRDIALALEYMLIAGMIETVMVCTKTKKRGLRVATPMEIDNG